MPTARVSPLAGPTRTFASASRIGNALWAFMLFAVRSASLGGSSSLGVSSTFLIFAISHSTSIVLAFSSYCSSLPAFGVIEQWGGGENSSQRQQYECVINSVRCQF